MHKSYEYTVLESSSVMTFPKNRKKLFASCTARMGTTSHKLDVTLYYGSVRLHWVVELFVLKNALFLKRYIYVYVHYIHPVDHQIFRRVSS